MATPDDRQVLSIGHGKKPGWSRNHRAVAGLTGPGLNPFKTATQNVLFHGAVQTGASVANQIGHNVLYDGPWNTDWMAAGSGAFGAARKRNISSARVRARSSEMLALT